MPFHLPNIITPSDSLVSRLARLAAAAVVAVVVTTSFASAQIPEALLGKWEGTLYEPVRKTSYTIEVIVVQGEIGESVGLVNYPEYECSSSLTLVEVDPRYQVAVTRETITKGQGVCIDRGRIMFMLDKGDLKLKWDHADYDHVAAGYLLRK